MQIHASPAGARLVALNLIDGRWQRSLDGHAGDSIDPSSGEELGRFAASAAHDARLAVRAARRALQAGGMGRRPSERALLLRRWGERLALRGDLAQLLTRENGKVLAQSHAEIAAALALLQSQAEALCCAAAMPAVGVVAILVPFSAPVIRLFEALVPALAAGCTVVIRPARQSAQIVAAVIGELAVLDGLPPGVVNVVSESGHDVTRELAASQEVDLLCFSGTIEGARKLARAAAPSGKRLLLDVADKSCCVILADADVKAVSVRLAAAALIGAGQHSSAPGRILVHDACFDEVSEYLVQALDKAVMGAGDMPDCALGPLADAATLVTAGVRIERALQRSASIPLHGRRGSGALAGGYFLSPTVMVERQGAPPVAPQDIYAPFIALRRFSDEDEALDEAEALRPTHVVSAWSSSAARARCLTERLQRTGILLNDHDWLAPSRTLTVGNFLAVPG
jgi:acyl-CoA reductase-like NAD-dependent aldehyde dehydrogenase